MASVNQTFLVYGVIILLGYTLKRFNILKESDGRCLINVIYYATLPAVIFIIFNGHEITISMLKIFSFSIAYGVLVLLLSLLFFRKVKVNMQKGLLISSVLGFNIPLFSYPFVQAIWGDEGMRVLAVFDVGNAFVIFGLAYVAAAFFSSDSSVASFRDIGIKLLFFVPLQCYVVAIILCLLKIELPLCVINILEPLTKANTPLVLIVLGLYLNFSGLGKYTKYIINVLSLRYATGLFIAFIIYFFLPCNEIVKLMLVLAVLNPVGLAMIAYSVYFKYDVKLAGALVNVSNVISFFLIWIITVFSTGLHNL